ncbi:GGDEF domain-containing protein [Ahrensia kielensis]|uniref:GGDEF domain-containing protein n=1 Tax=Ahrensia kielensis TaxID=76980 RepID=UPI00035C121D|nr:GGDEF domain-containing protein [Ahrensia kielensis]
MLIHELICQKISTEIDYVAPEATFLELASLLAKKRVESLVVTDEQGAMIGLITERDVVTAVGSVYQEIPDLIARDIMSTKIVSCKSTDSISSVLNEMQSLNIRHMPVVDNGKIITVIGIADLQMICQKLDKLAITDSLTGLFNRRAYENAMLAEYSRFKRHKFNFSIAILDIDFFKKINDTHGHSAGDMVLVEFAKALRANVRAYDFLARIGGEEFALILPNTELSDAIRVCEKLSNAIRAIELFNDSGMIKVTASFGVTAVSSAFSDVDEMIKFSDDLLYEAKEQGRDRIVAKSVASDDTKISSLAVDDVEDYLFS